MANNRIRINNKNRNVGRSMGLNQLDPKFMILEARPERYIKTPSSLILTLIRAAEAAAAFFLSFNVGAYLYGLFNGLSPGVFELTGMLQTGTGLDPDLGLRSGLVTSLLETVLQEDIGSILPEGATIDSLLEGVAGENEAHLRAIMEAGPVEGVLTKIAAASILIVLICTIAEALAFIFMRFALRGSALAKHAHKGIFYMSVVLLLSGIGLAVIFVMKCRRLGIAAALLTGELSAIGISGILSVALLFMASVYHKEIAGVLTAVDYELRMKFKETGVEGSKLSVNSLIFAALSAAATVWLALKTGPVSKATIVTAALTVKYLMVYSCWVSFKHAHM